MKKMMKRIAAIALMACMVLTMVPYASAASENTLTVKVTDRVLNKIVTMKNDTGLGDTAKLIESIFDIIGAETMGDGLSNAYKTAHRNHIAQGKSSSDPVCTPEKCGLYSIWTVELDDWFDDAKAAYLGGTWSSWISSDVDDGLFSGSSNGDLKEYLEDSTTPISKLTLKKEYTMTSANSRYVFSVTRTKPTGGGGGSVSNTTTETVKNEDGSVTTIITDKKTGTVTEITTGTNGVTATTVTDKNGNSSATEVVVPAGATEPVTLPLPIKDKDELNIDVPDGETKVVIPVKEDSTGNVVVIVHSDGTEEVVKGTTMTDGGVVVTLDKDATVKVVDKSKEFVDMDGHWANNAVDYVAARGLFAGTGDGTTFSPEVPMTRGMLAQVIYNLEGAEKHTYVHGFTDIPAGQWYTAAVNWAAREDVVAGYGDGSYKPNKILSREEFAQILYNYAKALGYDVNVSADLSTFADGDEVSWWATAAMQWAVGTGLMSGKGGNILGATHTATRAEGAQLFMNFMEKIIKH
ncbi:MAG: S-layer homology domain-containing protein [Ruminococcaceae bacterium]|nr:S-layer homology domain-containing protein [Oscillospiraceae bacterium]